MVAQSAFHFHFSLHLERNEEFFAARNISTRRGKDRS
jgi:hypothetical protein